MNTILQPVVVLGGLGLIFGIFLTYFHIRFHVEENPLVASIHSLLPNANCGACGLPGCSAFAEALAEDKVNPAKCVGLNQENMKGICRLLGLAEETREKKVARVFCSGGKSVARRFHFNSFADCRALNAIFDTNLVCAYGCIGLGNCVRVCPFDAIVMGENLPEIDEEKCWGCGRCVDECPKQIIHLVPFEKKVYVACSSHDRGAVVIKICKAGCIGCGKCVKVCPENAIALADNLAVIDYARCTNCGRCVEECPRKVIFSAPAKVQVLA